MTHVQIMGFAGKTAGLLRLLPPVRAAKRMAFLLVFAIAAFAPPAHAHGTAKTKVVTTIFPLYDWARQIGGNRVEVSQLVPPGVEPHTFALRPSDMLTLHRSDVFLYLGSDMEPWAPGILRSLDKPGLVAVEAGKGVRRRHHHGHSHGHEGCSGCSETDPHIWLDPVLAREVVIAIAAGLGRADPDGAEFYMGNAVAYNKKLDALHRRIEKGLESCGTREILYAGHFAFGYFAARYNLTYISPYRGFSPNAAPTPANVAEIIVRLRDSGRNIIFHEEMLDPKVARVIAAETGAALEVLHGAHNLTRDEWKRGDMTYLTIMEANLEKLRKALDCR